MDNFSTKQPRRLYTIEERLEYYVKRKIHAESRIKALTRELSERDSVKTAPDFTPEPISQDWDTSRMEAELERLRKKGKA